jgi:hypothetical protein
MLQGLLQVASRLALALRLLVELGGGVGWLGLGGCVRHHVSIQEKERSCHLEIKFN